MSSPWVSGQRVSRTRPCPVCGSTDWCGFSSDGWFVFCQRMDSWNGKRAIRQNDAGAMFALSERQSRESRRQSPPRSAIPRPPSLSHELLDRIYRELVQRTGLDDAARYDLITRRRFPTALETGIYFSLPRAGRENEELSEALINAFGLDVIERVPGFTFLCRECAGAGAIEGRTCTGCASLGKQRPRFRSVRGGRHDYGIIGCDASGLGFWGYSRRLPFEPQRDKQKYLLFSSGRAGEPGLAGLPRYHVAGREYPTDEVVITEGILKAEITAWKLRTRVIGLASTAVDDATLTAVQQLLGEWRSCAS